MDKPPELHAKIPVNKYIFGDNNARTILVYYSFILYAIITSTIPFIGTYFIHVINKAKIMYDGEYKLVLKNTEYIYNLVLASSTLTFIVSAIIFLFWLYRASSNAHALYPKHRFEFTPDWNVASYFIPILGLYWPYKAMKELWQSSNASNSSAAHLVVIWWILFITTNILGRLSDASPNEAQDIINISLIIAASITGIISAHLAVNIVLRINQSQMHNGMVPPQSVNSLQMKSRHLFIIFIIGGLLSSVFYFIDKHFIAAPIANSLHDQSVNEQPTMSTQAVEEWTIEALVAATSYNYHNYESQLKIARKYFTADGWSGYMSDLSKSKNIEAITNRQMKITTKVTGQPKIVSDGLLSGSYTWIFDIPISITYHMPPYDEKSSFSNVYTAVVTVQRQPLQTSNNGLGIVELKIKHENQK